jgi:large subunit ribosomal protein L9
MRVIIKETGEIKEVKDGYGRNFLIPRGLAVLATPQAIKKIERQKQEEMHKIQELAQKIEQTKLEMQVRVGERGKLFGGITPLKIAKALKEKGIKISKKQVLLKEPIKNLGKYSITIELASQLKPQLSLRVVAQSQNA